ncbi:MAG: hypothetical protein WC634_04660 [archaeon]
MNKRILLKKSSRQHGAALILSGLFGPNKKTTANILSSFKKQKVRMVLEELHPTAVSLKGNNGVWRVKQHSTLPDTIKAAIIENVLVNARRVAAKYALDAMGVSDKETRDFVRERLEKILERSYQRVDAQNETALSRDLSVRQWSQEIRDRIGVGRAVLLAIIFNKKFKRLKKQMLSI